MTWISHSYARRERLEFMSGQEDKMAAVPGEGFEGAQ